MGEPTKERPNDLTNDACIPHQPAPDLRITPQGGVTGDAYGAIPYGNGWYRAYITGTFSFGFSSLRTQVTVNSSTGSAFWTGDGSTGVYFWGAKLNKGAVDPYTAGSGQIFYANTEYNIKNYASDLLEGYMGQDRKIN